MLSLLFNKRVNDVRRLFLSRMNREFSKKIGEGGRGIARGAFCQVVWLIPCDSDGEQARFDRAVPVLTRDISPEGMGVFHTRRYRGVRIVLGLPDDAGMDFVLCDVAHCTPLGYGFYQIGLHPKTVFHLSADDAQDFDDRRAKFETEPACSV